MKRRLRMVAWVAGSLLAAGAVLRLVVPRPPLLERVAFSQQVQAVDGTLLRLTLADDERYRVFTPLDRLPDTVVDALLLQEDRFFYWHPGVNPVAVVKAMWEGMRGLRQRGASTITMQLARMRLGLNTRTLRGKLVQMLVALQYELHHSKREILTAYLNLAPYGRNVEGVGAAARVYLGKAPAALTLPEVLALTVVPQHPVQRGPQGMETVGGAAWRARQRLFERWLDDHPQAKAQAAVMRLPLRFSGPDDLPFGAPHLVRGVLEHHPHTARLVTTLSPPQQAAAQRAVDTYLQTVADRGIRNAAVLLVDTRDLSVRALVGSADFFGQGIHGQVDGTLGRRSPGSALKPFIYALAFQQGIIHTDSLLKDAPRRYGAYAPDNYDGRFLGPVPARNALTRSRNVPAVSLLGDLQPHTFHQLLADAGIGQLRDEDHYGLTLALGGVEVTLQELVGLYAMLANRGQAAPLRFLQDDARGAPRRLLTPEAAWMTLEVLKDTPRPRGVGSTRLDQGALPVRWKTGTSWGFRDAWAVGVFGPYAVGVWVGNFDGQGNPALVGLSAAGPLLFRVVQAIKVLEPHMREPYAGMPLGLNVRQVNVCAVSGKLPGPLCNHKVPAWFIPGVSPIHTCDIHREVEVEVASGLRSCAAVAGPTRRQVMEFWPSDLTSLFREAGIPRRAPPPYHPACSPAQRGAGGKSPAITSPQEGLAYMVRHQSAYGHAIPLLATADADARTLFWFADEAFVGRAPRGEPLMWRAPAGRHVVRVVDDLGRSAAHDVEVVQVE